MQQDRRPALEGFDPVLCAPVALGEYIGGVEEAREGESEGVEVSGFGDAENLQLPTRVSTRFEDGERGRRHEAGRKDERDGGQGSRMTVELCKGIRRESTAVLPDP